MVVTYLTEGPSPAMTNKRNLEKIIRICSGTLAFKANLQYPQPPVGTNSTI